MKNVSSTLQGRLLDKVSTSARGQIRHITATRATRGLNDNISDEVAREVYKHLHTQSFTNAAVDVEIDLSGDLINHMFIRKKRREDVLNLQARL